MVTGVRQSPASGHVLIIAAFAMLVGFSGLLTVPPLDRDESRFIQATTQMIETGDYVRISYQDLERNKKPVGIYWLQSVSVQLLADVEDRPLWAYRLPSLLGVVLAAIFTYMTGATLFGRRVGFLAAMLLAAAPVLAGEASIAKTDAALLAAICGMQAAFARLVTAPFSEFRRSTAAAFWIALAAGILIKGPIAPMIAVFTGAGLWLWSFRSKTNMQWLQRMKPIMGLAIIAVLVLPWAIAIGVMTEGRFYSEAVGKDMLGKVTSGQERHGGPFGYHLLALWIMFWPAALFIPAAVRHAVPRWMDSRFMFLLAWLLPMWILFEVTATKLPHYPMVLYPALALLIGHLLVSVPQNSYRALRWGGAVLYTLVGFVAAALIIYLAKTYSSDGVTGWHMLAAGVIVSGTLVAAFFSIRRDSIPALTIAILASGIFAWVAFEGVLPTLDRLSLTPRLAAMLDRNEAHPLRDDTGAIALVGYHEPSAVFILGTNTQLLTPEQAAIWLIAARRRAVVVERRMVDDFLDALPPGTMVEVVDSIEGFNYSNNKDMRLTLYRLRR